MYEQKPRHLVSRKLHACIHYINDLRKMALNVVETELSRFERFRVGLIIWLLPHRSSVFAAQYRSMVACLGGLICPAAETCGCWLVTVTISTCLWSQSFHLEVN
jgi:hypothetical protein